MQNNLGPIALLGSGETSLSGGRLFETISRGLPGPLRIVILETPAGFELNSLRVASRVADFLEARLQKYTPQIDILPARKRDTFYSPDDSSILHPLLQANLIFMGPGSPTYAVRQLKDSLAWELVRARHRQGAALVFSSAGAIAIGAFALPVYEVYKVGEEVAAKPGLNILSDFNLAVSILPHWNNKEGGDEVDTSRCFIGVDRFTQWCRLLPEAHIIIGLDEHTGLMIDFGTRNCYVSGVGSVTLTQASISKVFQAGTEFPIDNLGEFRLPAEINTGILIRSSEMMKNDIEAVNQQEVPAEVIRLAELRQRARLCRDWLEADSLRQQIANLGWIVQDTSIGQKIIRQS